MESVFNFGSFAGVNRIGKLFKLTDMYLLTVYFYFCYPRFASILEPDARSAACVVSCDRRIPAVLGVTCLSQINDSVICPDVIDMVYLFVWPDWVFGVRHIPCESVRELQLIVNSYSNITIPRAKTSGLFSNEPAPVCCFPGE